MPQHLVWLFGRAGIAMKEADGNGSDLPGGNVAADQGKPDGSEPAQQPGKNQPASEGDEDDQGDKKPSQPSDAEARLLKDVMKHKERAKTLEGQLSSFQRVMGDLTADDVAALIAQKREAERQELEKRGEYDRILEQVKTEHQGQVTTLQGQIEALQAQLNDRDSAVMEMTIGRSFSESAFIRDKSLIPASIARKEFGTHVELVDGQVVVYDKPKGSAERTPLVDGNGQYKTFEEGIEHLYAKHVDSARLIRAQTKPGAGSKNEDLGGKQPTDQKPIGTGMHRIAAGLAKKNQ